MEACRQRISASQLRGRTLDDDDEKAISIVQFGQSANPLSQKSTVSRSPAQIAASTHNINLIVAQTGSRRRTLRQGSRALYPKHASQLHMESRSKHAACRRPGDNNNYR
jgi:hypothetical protein